MKLIAALLTAVTGLIAASPGDENGITVRICVDSNSHGLMMAGARRVAAQVMASAGVRIEWRNSARPCRDDGGITVRLSTETASNNRPGALAYSTPYEGNLIVLMLDRIQAAIDPAAAHILMGHALAHEIGHVLEGINRHSERGLMKARWDMADFADMRLGRVRFAEHDVDLIQMGLKRFSQPVVVAGLR
mgnify:CR=1 FL=1